MTDIVNKPLVCGEIEYVRQDGCSIHSDLCSPNVNIEELKKNRQFLHDCLDEWLNKSNGTGCFYLKQEISIA